MRVVFTAVETIQIRDARCRSRAAIIERLRSATANIVIEKWGKGAVRRGTRVIFTLKLKKNIFNRFFGFLFTYNIYFFYFILLIKCS